MDKVSGAEISMGRAEPVRDTEPTEKDKEPDPETQVPQTEAEKRLSPKDFLEFATCVIIPFRPTVSVLGLL